VQESLATKVFLPTALGIIMLGLGLTLTLADFKRVVVYPRAVIVGLVCQMLVLPFACYGIARAFALPPELAVGLMLLAASPGGATANLFSHLAKGDVALNITLTAVNSVLSLFTLPLIVNVSLERFLGVGKAHAAAARQGDPGVRHRAGAGGRSACCIRAKKRGARGAARASRCASRRRCSCCVVIILGHRGSKSGPTSASSSARWVSRRSRSTWSAWGSASSCPCSRGSSAVRPSPSAWRSASTTARWRSPSPRARSC
jgi:hypothetical protein